MKIIHREGLIWRIALGLISGIVTIFFFTLDTINPNIRATNSAYNYSMIVVMFYILFVMNFIAGMKREYEVSLSYILLMVGYDLATTGLVTVLFAGVAFVSLMLGLVVSFVIPRLGITWREEETAVF